MNNIIYGTLLNKSGCSHLHVEPDGWIMHRAPNHCSLNVSPEACLMLPPPSSCPFISPSTLWNMNPVVGTGHLDGKQKMKQNQTKCPPLDVQSTAKSQRIGQMGGFCIFLKRLTLTDAIHSFSLDFSLKSKSVTVQWKQRIRFGTRRDTSTTLFKREREAEAAAKTLAENLFVSRPQISKDHRNAQIASPRNEQLWHSGHGAAIASILSGLIQKTRTLLPFLLLLLSQVSESLLCIRNNGRLRRP